MSSYEKVRLNFKEKHDKKNQRQTLSEQAKEKVKLDDSERKELKRKHMSTEEKSRFNDKEKQDKKNQRQTLSEQAKEKAKLDDKGNRSNVNICQNRKKRKLN